ncbi:hypothetical protein QL285_029989 [Trifolium repens]|jgi:hypothetical protein|nr:hypothetical protein QL285_029989 [Trifolium repens]
MSIDELQSSLLVHEGRMKIHKAKDEEQALKISNLGRGYSAGNNNRGKGRGARGRGTDVINLVTTRMNVPHGKRMPTLLRSSMRMKKC